MLLPDKPLHPSARLPFAYGVLLLAAILLYAPLISLIISSFNDSYIAGRWTHFTLKWYVALMDNHMLLSSLMVSLRIAFTSATLGVALGVLAAIYHRHCRQGGLFYRLQSGLMSTPLVVPEILTGMSFLFGFIILNKIIGWPEYRGFWTVVMAHATLGMAYTFLIIHIQLDEFDRSLEEAAADLGAGPLRVYTEIILPLITPSIIVSWILAFIISMDDVVIASFLSGPGSSTLPLLVFSSVRMGISPEMNALAGLIVLSTLILVSIAMAIIKWRRKIFKFLEEDSE